ncbi:MAG: outer membrane lipoprotein carrier protein LolA [Melioribacteraceae bacterium]
MNYLFVIILSVVLSFVDTNNNTVEKLQKKFDSLTNLQADFVQLTNNEEGMKGKFYFTQKDKYRIELKNNTIISDEISIWNWDKKRDKVIISNIEDDPLSFSLREYIFNYPGKCTVTERSLGGGETLVTLKAENTELNFESANLWITDNNLISKIEVKDFNNNTFGFVFNNIEINKSLKTSLFKFNETGDYKIIDLR